MSTDLASAKAKRSGDSEKLIKVLSTKVSIEDYIRFLKFTNDAYKTGIIEKPSPLKFLRFIVTCPFKELGL